MYFKNLCEIHIKFVQKLKLSSPSSVFADARSKFQYRFTRLCFPHSTLHITFYLTCKIARQSLAKISLCKCNLIRDSAELSLLDAVEHIEIAFIYSTKHLQDGLLSHRQLTTNISSANSIILSVSIKFKTHSLFIIEMNYRNHHVVSFDI